TIQKHFRLEEPFYRILDAEKRVPDRGLIHQLRNDHAAVLFSFESLLIRLRKQGPNEDWRQRLESLMNVLLPHLDLEEQRAFPLADELLTPEEKTKLSQ